MPSTSGDNLAGALSHVVGCFRRARVPYVLIGAWALAVWGRPRTTLDLDFLVLVDEKGLDRLGALMTRAGMEFDETWLEWNPMLRGDQIRFRRRGFTVDLMRPRDVHDREVFRRRKRKRLEGRSYWVVSAEDFILQKLKVGRPRDFEDASSVVKRMGGHLNRKYLERWARRLGVIGELDYVMGL
ncbi:MAG: hypothetical protein HYT78_21820 [Deltaproteobacteria bacterium]|nr:hypothetical protein [Deltaproteobacteria bacterium]